MSVVARRQTFASLRKLAPGIHVGTYFTVVIFFVLKKNYPINEQTREKREEETYTLVLYPREKSQSSLLLSFRTWLSPQW